ncbi:MAG: NlpC/P60 family protein [Desulfobulbales bacterium]
MILQPANQIVYIYVKLSKNFRHKQEILFNFVFILPFIILAGCSPQQKSTSIKHGHTPEYSYDLSSVHTVKKALYSQYEEWKHVKYKKGGLSERGIDCSGFVYMTYLTKFGIKLPRTTEKMLRLGEKISQKNLVPGDLVFFKTGLFSRHVGIYLDKRRFLHASTSVGVTISSLDNHYWKKNYWKSIRIAANLR